MSKNVDYTDSDTKTPHCAEQAVILQVKIYEVHR